MTRSKSFLLSWLPAIVWMMVIFGASTDLMSSRHTSRFIGPVLRWFNPDVSETTIRQVQLVVRKSAHVTEYAILALLLYRALRRSWKRPSHIWCPASARWAFALAVLYAASDEWHQSFVPSRDGTVHDAIIDGAGAALGLLLWQRWLSSRRYRELHSGN